MFIELTAYRHRRIINTDHIVEVWSEKVYGKTSFDRAYKVVTRIRLTNDIIDVAEPYDDVVYTIDNASEDEV